MSAEVEADVFTPFAVDQALTIAGGWGVVHGLAKLLIDGRLNRLAAGTAGAPSPMELVEQVLERTALELTEMKPSAAT